MQHTIKKLPKSQIEITIEVPTEEYRTDLEGAAQTLAAKTKIPGFRPGHAPYAEVEKRFGAMKILEEALELIVRRSYLSVIMEEKIETIGSPHISVSKMAPGNPLVFTLTATVLPAVTRLADYTKLRIVQKPIEVADADVDLILKDIQKMQTRETRATRPIEERDRVVLDLDISRERLPLEGGQVKGHVVIMDEPYYIPGLTDELRGLREGEEKTFSLNFPATHYQKHLAGQLADFRVKINEVYERSYPEVNDALAQSLGKPTLAELKDLLRENIKREKASKESERQELELLDQVIASSQFEDVPDLLVNQEVNRMCRELEHGVAEQGLEWKDYLTQIKKSEADLKLEFSPQAIRRVKTLLAVREVAEREKITVTDQEVDHELDRIAAHYKDDPETKKQIFSPEHREQVAAMLKNRKTIARLKELAQPNKLKS